MEWPVVVLKVCPMNQRQLLKNKRFRVLFKPIFSESVSNFIIVHSIKNSLYNYYLKTNEIISCLYLLNSKVVKTEICYIYFPIKKLQNKTNST